MGGKCKIFVSYAREDEGFKDELLAHVRSLRHIVEVWHDRDITDGHWGAEIAKAIEESDVAFVLVSHFFLSSDFVMDNELPHLLEQERRGLSLIPIIVRPCNWILTPLSQFQVYPQDGRPLVEIDKENGKRDKVLSTIVDRALSKKIIGKPKSDGQNKDTAVPMETSRTRRWRHWAVTGIALLAMMAIGVGVARYTIKDAWEERAEEFSPPDNAVVVDQQLKISWPDIRKKNDQKYQIEVAQGKERSSYYKSAEPAWPLLAAETGKPIKWRVRLDQDSSKVPGWSPWFTLSYYKRREEKIRALKELRVGVAESQGPFVSTTSNGGGFEFALLKEIFSDYLEAKGIRSNIKITPVYRRWGDEYLNLLRDDSSVDLLASGISITAEREKKHMLSFSLPSIEYFQYLIANEPVVFGGGVIRSPANMHLGTWVDSTNMDTACKLADMRPKCTSRLVSGYSGNAELSDMANDLKNIKPFGVVVDAPYVAQIKDAVGGGDRIKIYKIDQSVRPEIQKERIGYALREGDDDLKSIIDEWIDGNSKRLRSTRDDYIGNTDALDAPKQEAIETRSKADYQSVDDVEKEFERMISDGFLNAAEEGAILKEILLAGRLDASSKLLEWKKKYFKTIEEVYIPESKNSKPFYMMTHEVTLKMFREQMDYLGNIDEAARERQRERERIYGSLSAESTDSIPAVDITWKEAHDFCEHYGESLKTHYRLPTSEEWARAAEIAGRSVSQGSVRISHWGGERRIMEPVRSHFRDRSIYGVYDVVGNVSEWVENSLPGTAGMHYTKGLSYKDNVAEKYFDPSLATPRSGDSGYEDIGFRCLRDTDDPSPVIFSWKTEETSDERRRVKFNSAAESDGNGLGSTGCASGQEGGAKIYNFGSIEAHLLPRDVKYQLGVLDSHLKTEEGEKIIGGGVAWLASVAKKTSDCGSLLVDTGNFLQGDVLGNKTKGKAVIDAYNEAGIDVAALGNYEFDFGQPVLFKRMSESRFPIIASNIMFNGTKLTPSAVIREVNGIRVGLVGLFGVDGKSKISPVNFQGFEVSDPISVARDTVDKIRHKVDVVAVLSHMSFEEEKKLGENVSGIDIIFGEPSDKSDQPNDVTLNKTRLLRVNFGQGFQLGETSIRRKGNDIEISYRVHEVVRDFLIKAGYAENSTVASKVQKMNEDVLRDAKYSVGRAAGDFSWAKEDIRSKEMAIGDLVADAYKAAFGEADLAIVNSGSIRDGIASGDVTYYQITKILPFDAQVVLIDLSGDELKQVFENSVSKLESINGRFLQVSGCKVEYDTSREIGNRVVRIVIDGKGEVTPDGTYSVVIPSFMHRGGDDYGMLKGKKEKFSDNYQALQAADAVADYIRGEKDIYPRKGGRITFK